MSQGSPEPTTGSPNHEHRGRRATHLSARVVDGSNVEVLAVRGGGRDGLALFQDWEAVSVDVWGPRAGKSSSRAIPAIMAAPGAVVATSNKRDHLDATRDPRTAIAAAGGPADRVWVFDPQRLVDEPVDWWWNPLSYVSDETRARTLADVFANAVRKPGARTDVYFDAAALDLLACLLLAAAAAGRDLAQVYLWLTDPNDDEPATLLETAGYPLPAAAVRGVVGSPDKQRAGVYGTAQQVASFMTNTAAMRWVTPTVPPRRAGPTRTMGAVAGAVGAVGEGCRGSSGPRSSCGPSAPCTPSRARAAGMRPRWSRADGRGL